MNKNMGDFVKNVDEEMDLKRGPWIVEEDLKLINYISTHGEGRWNYIARCAGLKRTGKSCRLRWLNYLRPNVRRGNITLEEQLLILELHSRWGNRWSKIAQYLPGRTDNEVKNYWRTRVQKHAKQLRCDVNSKQFKDTMKYLWMPRLVERIQAASSTGYSATSSYDAVNNSNTNMDNLSLLKNPNYGYTTPENDSVAVSPALTESTGFRHVGKIENIYNPDYNSVGPLIMSQSHNDLDGNVNGGLLNGDLTALQERSYFNWFENINEVMIPSYSDTFCNIGSESSDQDFWLLYNNMF
ncbi:unnamed protein product [Cochlearia groenlandica]